MALFFILFPHFYLNNFFSCSEGNRLNDKVAIALAETLKKNSALAELDLSYNELGEAGGYYLGTGLVSKIFLSMNSLLN